MKICKVAVTNVFMWIAIWTPYAGEFYLSFNDSLVSKVRKIKICLAGVVMMAVFGDRNKITPLMAQCPSMAAKAATCFNPIVFALSHPK